MAHRLTCRERCSGGWPLSRAAPEIARQKRRSEDGAAAPGSSIDSSASLTRVFNGQAHPDAMAGSIDALRTEQSPIADRLEGSMERMRIASQIASRHKITPSERIRLRCEPALHERLGGCMIQQGPRASGCYSPLSTNMNRRQAAARRGINGMCRQALHGGHLAGRRRGDQSKWGSHASAPC